MKIVVLDALTLGEDLDLTPLNSLADKVEIYQTTKPEDTIDRIKSADIVVTNKVVLNRETLMMATKLKLVCITATGMNNVDLKAAKGMGIEVKNVAGYSTHSVVQHTFTLLFTLLESICYYDEYSKSKKWSKSNLFTHLGRPFFELNGKRWGIIGLGTIGSNVAKVAQAFGCEVVYYSTSNNPHSSEYRHMDIKELLSSSDIISIHAPLNENTDGLIDKKKLDLLKEGSIILNLGRGGIIDEEALANTLNNKEIYAGLDVLTNEPPNPNHPLLNLDYPQRLCLTPHIAWTSIEARNRLFEGVLNNIKEFLEKR